MSHSHDHAQRAGRRHLSKLVISFWMVAIVMVAEILGGLITGSLALLADAGHMATDALGLGMAWAAIWFADRGASPRSRSYGLYRLEILAALANSLLLLGVAVYVVVEAMGRFANPPDVLSGPMMAVATVGLMVNVISWWLLRAGAEDSINLEGAMLEVLADLIGSVGVIGAAIAIRLTGLGIIDPILGIAIGLFIVPRALRLGRKALRVLIQATPAHIDTAEIEGRLRALEGVTAVHDLHIWTLTSEMDVATVHLVAVDEAVTHAVLDRARALLEDTYGIAHATLQVEPPDHEGCTCVELDW